MKTWKFISPVILLLLSVSYLTEAAYSQQLGQAYLIRSFEVSEAELVEIQTSGGFIEVHGSAGTEVRVEMYVRRGGRYLNESDTSLDNFEIEVEQVGNSVRAYATRESGSGWRFWRDDSGISISFIVHTPRHTNVDARTSGGSISAINLEGQIQLRTSGGSLSLSSLNGFIDARTSGGSISIEDVEGELTARTSGGNISGSSLNGKMDLRTSGGSISLDEIGGTVSAHTSGGSIRAKLFQVGELVELQTSGGNIAIEVPEGNGYDLDLRGTSVRTELRNFSGEVERNRVIGVINNGGPVIRARTSGGSVRINYI
jgi:DUF4097 and DUF4098 domain-containing protein YvlB